MNIISNCQHVPAGFVKGFMFGVVFHTSSNRIDFGSIRPWLASLPQYAHASLDLEGDVFGPALVNANSATMDDVAMTLRRMWAIRADLTLSCYGYPSANQVFKPEDTRDDGIRAGKQFSFLRHTHELVQSCYIAGDYDPTKMPLWYLQHLAALTQGVAGVKRRFACLRTRFPEGGPKGLELIPKPMLRQWAGWCDMLFGNLWHWNEIRSYAAASLQDPNTTNDPMQRLTIIDAKQVFRDRFRRKDGTLNEEAVAECEREDAEWMVDCLPATNEGAK